MRAFRFALLALAATAALAPRAALASLTCGTVDSAPAEAAFDSDRPAPLFKGLGDLRFPITTDSKKAQAYFEQGLLLAYGFNHAEAARSFHEVTRLDPDCPMGWWGVALVLGPNINAPMMQEDVGRAWHSLNKAHEFSHLGSPKEQALVGALMKRYVDGAPEDRSPLDAAYADAMREVAKQFPSDVDVLALAAEAQMDLHPWDFFDRSTFEERPWTAEIVGLLERGMKLDPKHPGINHLYIHAVEASRNPDRASPAAKRLGKISPSQGHLVHMPSHIYIRTGEYHAGSMANERAMKADDGYIAACHMQGVYPLIYRTHNHHFLWATATFEGASAKALRAAESTAALVQREMFGDPFLGGVLQHWTVIPMYGMVRFGRWEDILAWKPIEGEPAYPRAIRHYARGIAFERLGRPDDADRELEALREAAKEPELEKFMILGLNPTSKLATIAERILTGEIAVNRGDHDTGIAAMREALETELSLTYDEPPDWFFPVRHNLGAALLAAGKAEEAETVYRDDLFVYPENGWSLLGLQQALEAQGKSKEARDVAKRFKKAWAHADFELKSSRM